MVWGITVAVYTTYVYKIISIHNNIIGNTAQVESCYRLMTNERALHCYIVVQPRVFKVAMNDIVLLYVYNEGGNKLCSAGDRRKRKR